MTDFEQFRKQCKMRHDFGDQIQVRYQHADGETFDTWVSGEEALQRLDTVEAEKQLKSLSSLTVADLHIVMQSLPNTVKKVARKSLREEVADRLETGIGGNLIGDALSEAVRGRSSSSIPAVPEKDRWLALVRYEPFRQIVLELAWIQLEGSLPDLEAGQEPNDWL